MGIYGFLSAAYQETYQKLVVNQNQIEFLENKAKFYEDDVLRYDTEIERISNNISTLSNAKARSIQVRDTSVVGGVRSTVSTAELRLAQNRLAIEEGNRKDVYLKRSVAADSLQTIKLDILALQNDSDTVGELGPLQYLSGLTGTPMDKIINWLLLIIIFVFDPLAISLVIAANFAFDIANRKNLYGEVDNDLYTKPKKKDNDNWPRASQNHLDEWDIDDIEVKDAEEISDKKEFQKEIDKIEKVVKANKDTEDWKVVDENDKPLPEPKPVKIVQKGPSQHRVLFNDGKQRKVSKDDDIIKRYL